MVEINSIASSLRRLLWQELEYAGLTIDYTCYRNCLGEVGTAGTVAQQSINLCVRVSDWRAANSSLDRPFSDSDLVRVLGFGRLLTEFIVTPVDGCSRHMDLRPVLELGALANLIVTLYDLYVDQLPNGASTLPKSVLQEIMLNTESGQLPDVQPHAMGPAGVMLQLVTLYCTQLNSLTYATQHTKVRDFIYHLINTMYDAEITTADKLASGSSQWMLRRKSSLPFVVMGLPVWLVYTDIPRLCFTWHLRWLYRVGDFIGWVDDVLDLETDQQTGHPNRVRSALAESGEDARQLKVLASRIAQRGKHLTDEWQEHLSPSYLSSSLGTNILPAVLVSWFGGTAPQA